MSELFRVRVDKELLKKANQTCSELGVKTQAVVKMLFVQIVKRKEIPFRITAETPEDELLQSPQKRRAILESFHESKAR